MAWSKDNLQNHRVETRGGIKIIQTDSGAEPEGAADIRMGGGAALEPQVAATNLAISRGDLRGAIQLITGFAEAARGLRTEADAACVCVENQRQLAYYLANHPELKGKKCGYCTGASQPECC